MDPIKRTFRQSAIIAGGRASVDSFAGGGGMIFGGKKDKKDNDKPKKRAAKRVRRESGRKLFAFRCSPPIKASLVKIHDALHVNLFALSEHCLQLGAIQLEEACRDPEEREELRQHLIEDHTERRTIEKVSAYDQEAGEMLARERRRRFEIDRAARILVAQFASRFDLRKIEEIIDLGVRTKYAMIVNGAPPPPHIPGYRRSPRPGNAPRPRREDRVSAESEPDEEYEQEEGEE